MLPPRSLGIRSVDPTARRAVIAFATGTPILVRDGIIERLEITEDAVDLSYLNTGTAPLLTEHSYYNTAVLGTIEGAWIEDTDTGPEARCIARFRDTPVANFAFEMLEEGALIGASAGYSNMSRTFDGRTGEVTVTSWRPFEVSLTIIPADVRSRIITTATGERSRNLYSAAVGARQHHAVTWHRRLRGDAWMAWAAQTADELAARFGIDPENARDFMASAVRNQLNGLCGESIGGEGHSADWFSVDGQGAVVSALPPPVPTFTAAQMEAGQ